MCSYVRVLRLIFRVQGRSEIACTYSRTSTGSYAMTVGHDVAGAPRERTASLASSGKISRGYLQIARKKHTSIRSELEPPTRSSQGGTFATLSRHGYKRLPNSDYYVLTPNNLM